MKMKLLTILSIATLALHACGGGGGGSAPKAPDGASLDTKIKSGKVLAKRGDVEIHEGFVELLKSVNPNIEGQINNPQGKKRLVDSLLEQEMLFQEATKRGISKLPKYQEKTALYGRIILAQGVVEEEIERMAKEEYEKTKEEEFSQIQVSHILVKTPRIPEGKDPTEEQKKEIEEAKKKIEEAKKKLDEGVAWETVVEEYTDDRFTKKRGGDLGKLSKNDRRAERFGWKPLLDKAFTMKATEIAGPIEANDGWHIIKLVEEAKIAAYDEVKNQIEFKLRAKAKDEMIANISGGSEIVYVDEELKNVEDAPKPEMPFPGAKPAPAPKPAPAAKNEDGKKPEAKKAEEKQPEATAKADGGKKEDHAGHDHHQDER